MKKLEELLVAERDAARTVKELSDHGQQIHEALLRAQDDWRYASNAVQEELNLMRARIAEAG